MISPADKVEWLEIEDDHGQDAKVQLPLLLGAGGHIRLAVGKIWGIYELLFCIDMHFT